MFLLRGRKQRGRMFCKTANFRNTSLKICMWRLKGEGRGWAISVSQVSVPGRQCSVDWQWHWLLLQPRHVIYISDVLTCMQTCCDVGGNTGIEGPAHLNSYAMFVPKLSEFTTSWGYWVRSSVSAFNFHYPVAAYVLLLVFPSLLLFPKYICLYKYLIVLELNIYLYIF